MKRTGSILTLIAIIFCCTACNKEDEDRDCTLQDFFCEYDTRVFQMGFSTWAYAPTTASVEGTYAFIGENADIYSEHIDSRIPWDAWINDRPLPAEFTNEIAGRAARRIQSATLTVSVSLLNSSRDELAPGMDGSTPAYDRINDPHIEDAYFKHLVYIAEQLNPDYLILAIEVNELLKNSPEKWEDYKSLMANIRTRIRQEFPALEISESITLHNFYRPDVPDPAAFAQEIADYANDLDFVAVSFYPFFKGLNSHAGFEEAFGFLHEKINKSFAIAETGHLSEDLTVESFDLFIPGSEPEQKAYLEVLLTHAQEENYRYIIWWTHRDYDALWETFPDDVKDLGKLWISNGLLNEDGVEKEGMETWKQLFDLEYKPDI